MIGRRNPSGHLFPHKFTHKTATITKSGGAKVETWTTANTNVKSFVQNADEEVLLEYKKLDKNVTHSIFFLSKTIFNEIKKQDRIVWDGGNYDVVGKKNPCNLDVVFRIDVESEA